MTYSLDAFQNGQVVLVDKPIGWTSFQVVNKIRWLLCRQYGIKKIKVGHAGTLDPLATGLLLVCTGKMTKQIQDFVGADKAYTGTICLGATTPSYDLETTIEPQSNPSHLRKEDLIAATATFRGHLKKNPPLFTQKKKKPTRLYEHARAGEHVDVPDRDIIIHQFEITSIELPDVGFEIQCGKGTYIRSIAHDYGQVLGVGGYLKKLCRTAIGTHTLAQAISIETFEKNIQS
jgi:tRNA pseudouridine55 synthase